MELAPLALAAILMAGCAGVTRQPAPPPAEFLVATSDSTFWVRTDSTGLHLRGSPLQIARVDGRYYEIYVADDDRSFADGVFVGQRVYRRDLLSGDSTVIYRDTVVGPIAAAWERRHPNAPRLAPDEPAEDNPDTRAIAEIEFLDLHGPWLSLELHVDVDGRTAPHAHDTRRAVADLRTGRAATLAELFGSGTARSVAAAGRSAFSGARDSVRRIPDAIGARARAALDALRFDDTSFSIEALGDAPAVAFLVPGGGKGARGITLPLTPIRAVAPDWWATDVRGTIATTVAGTGPGRALERWQRPRYELLARTDTAGAVIALALRDSARREFAIGRMHGEVRRVFWLDAAPLDSAARRGLTHAFDEAAFYSDDVKTASVPLAPPLLNARDRAHDHARASAAPRRGVVPRNVAHDDADRRQQPRPRVRWRHPRDDRYDSRRVGHPARTRDVRDRVDRSRRLP